MNKNYYLDQAGAFVIEDYQHTKLFSDFFPGVSGLYGIPMWAFFVNRGQAVSSFGIESKDKSILEFQPANKAYRLTSIQGFRTFLKIKDGAKFRFYEPFANPEASVYKIKQRMLITSHDLTIEEINKTLGIKITVNYFTLPQEPFAGLVRGVTIENIGGKNLDIQCIDGLPMINAYGLKDWLGKHMSRTVEAWINVHYVKNKTPFYQLKVEVADTPQVVPIKEGNFYFAFDNQSGKLCDMLVESACVFGQASDFLYPENFIKDEVFKVPEIQQTANRTPCAMSFKRFDLTPNQKFVFTAVTGFAHHQEELKNLVKKLTRKDFIAHKALVNKQIIDDIKGYCLTTSDSAEFNQYCGQTFLDNILRGGLPISLQTAQGAETFNVYSRKHGDLERDYNFFMLAPTFLSQGNGNYRDVNQNRRNDIWFNADVKETSLVNFLNLIQADGYNPLIVKGAMFVIKDVQQIKNILERFGIVDDAHKLHEMLQKGFMPGDLLKQAADVLPVKNKSEDFLTAVLGLCAKYESAEPGEGFWSDHWTYNLDLIESYLAFYPENLHYITCQKKVFSFFLNDFYVLPRDARLVLTDHGVRQYHSLAEHDKEVQARARGYKLRVKKGEGDVYTTCLVVKLICILTNKIATLDPSGIGIEMEANKPNWYDALNGLPGLLGSSISETFEVKRLAIFLTKTLTNLALDNQHKFMVFEELADFFQGLSHVLYNESDAFKYWQKSNDIKEHYRQSIRLGINGLEKSLTVLEIKKFLTAVIDRCDQGIQKARYDNGLFATYFYHEVLSYDVLDKSHQGASHVRPKSFKRHDLPLFLEGFVHALRTEGDIKKAELIFKAVKSSSLFDRRLGMYKVNASLSKESDEIGRTRIFPAGWLENESVWLHMAYKYLLELLRGGLVKEYYDHLKTAMVPFLDPAVYGRSILQNSSFIVSSAHEDVNLHGQGFVARLSGSTAEFLHMWLIMNLGLNPFTVNKEGQLNLTFNPLLASWLFTKKQQANLPAHSYGFKLFAKILVTYHNPQLKDTFGPQGVKVKNIVLTYQDKRTVEISGNTLDATHALDVRECRVKQINAYLG